MSASHRKADIAQINRRWVEKNREKSNAIKKKYTLANREKCNARTMKWAKDNREMLNDRHRKWVKDNPDKAYKKNRMYRVANRSRYLAHTRLRQAKKLQATPSWLTEEQLNEMASWYEQAVLCEQLTGAKHHVDHIEPLQGKDRCGLHVPWNLQVLTASENASKGNR